MLIAKSSHFQGVGDTTTAFFGQTLNVWVGVIVRHQNGVFFLQSSLNASFKPRLFFSAERLRLRGVGQVFLNKDTVFGFRHEQLLSIAFWQ